MTTSPSERSDQRRALSLGAGAILAVGLALALWAVLHPAAGTAAQSQYAPTNTAPPTISGTPAEGATLTAVEGTWVGTGLVFTYQWQRCNASGAACVAAPGSTGKTYTIIRSDVGQTLRVAVTARNAQGAATATSAQTAVVSGPPGSITLPNGLISIPVSSVPATERLIVDRVQFSPSPIRSRTQPITARVTVRDTRGYAVRNVEVFIRSTPLVTVSPPPARTIEDGTITYVLTPERDFPQIRNGYNLQFFVKAYRQGDNPLGGVAGYRLVQVPMAR